MARDGGVWRGDMGGGGNGGVGWADLPIACALSSIHGEGLLVDVVHKGNKASLAVACPTITCRHKRLLLSSRVAVREETCLRLCLQGFIQWVNLTYES